MLLNDDVVTYGKAKSGALASGLRREERIEDPLLYLGQCRCRCRESDLHTIAKAHGGSSKGRLVVASICFRFALRRRIEAVGNQIEQNPPVTESLTVNSIEKSAVQSS